MRLVQINGSVWINPEAVTHVYEENGAILVGVTLAPEFKIVSQFSLVETIAKLEDAR